MTWTAEIRTRVVACRPIVSDAVQVELDDDEQIVHLDYVPGSHPHYVVYTYKEVSE